MQIIPRESQKQHTNFGNNEKIKLGGKKARKVASLFSLGATEDSLTITVNHLEPIKVNTYVLYVHRFNLRMRILIRLGSFFIRILCAIC